MDLSVVKNFQYELPEELIAHEPLEQRDRSRLLLFDRQSGRVEHRHFYQLADLLTKDDVLVLNKSKVFPARLYGKRSNGKDVEVLLFRQLSNNSWRAITRPGLRPEMEIYFSHGVSARVAMGDKVSGEVDLEFRFPQRNIFAALGEIGQTPIPSYIRASLPESILRERYQTVYAKETGSAAAPTAGLHFTQELLEKLVEKGVQIEYITLHVGLGTFQALREEHFRKKALHTEYYDVSAVVAERLNTAKRAGKRIIAVGTTTTRTLESVVSLQGEIVAKSEATQLFIYPPYKFKFVDSMITNFHLSQSSLLMLVSAFTSEPNTSFRFKIFEGSEVGRAYREAIEKRYRFYSFGDAMWIY